MTRVKICGLTRAEDALAAAEAGADALGFMLWPESKRAVRSDAVAAFIPDLPPFLSRVAVTVNFDTTSFDRLEHYALFDTFQLHGDEQPADCPALRPKRLVKALRLQSGEELPDAAAYPVDAFLLDTPGEGYGGSGKSFDWSLAVKFKQSTDKPIILAGGLTPENVAQAVEQVQPYAVDVSSGVEASPGRKDHAKVRDFIQAVRGAGAPT